MKDMHEKMLSIYFGNLIYRRLKKENPEQIDIYVI